MYEHFIIVVHLESKIEVSGLVAHFKIYFFDHFDVIFTMLLPRELIG